MAILSSFYTVSINTLTGPPNSDGFIDHTKIEQYMATGAAPTTVAQSLTKERANIRFDLLNQNLSLSGNIYVNNPVATGGNATTSPTNFAFTAHVERGDSILSTADETSPGTTLTGAAALKRFVARALLTSSTNDQQEYYDPTPTGALTANGATVSAIRVGSRIEKVTAGKLANTVSEAEAVITVTKIL